MKTNIEIDKGAGPCFGVQRAIGMAEGLLKEREELACLGDLIHNDEEIERLKKSGLHIISHCQLAEQSKKELLLRAHGEPPSTFRIAANFEIDLVDATCPIVKQLQKQMNEASKKMEEQNGQLILFGDLYHAEVMALKGYCRGDLHCVSKVEDLASLNSKKPTMFFSQTTKYQSDYHEIINAFRKKRVKEHASDFSLEVIDSACKQVAKRDLQLVDFLKDKEVLIFVSSRKSSNGNYLFNVGKKKVKAAYFISNPSELQKSWFKFYRKIGISGATSTPLWLLEETNLRLKEMLM